MYKIGDFVLLKTTQQLRAYKRLAHFDSDSMSRYCNKVYRVKNIDLIGDDEPLYYLDGAGSRPWSDKMIARELAPRGAELDVRGEKIELSPTPERDALGLLEKTLADIISKTQAEKIYNDSLADLRSRIDTFIRDTYGAITRKVTLKLNEKEIDFDGEILHSKFEDVLSFCAADEPVFLIGPAGSGKNVLCKQIAKALDLDFYFTNAVTQEYKITGFTDAFGEFQETSFYRAFKNGGLFFLDELDASIPEVLVILNAAIANRYFDFPAPIGYVEAHENFRIIAAGNTYGLGASSEYVGRNQLDAASLDRFALIEIDYDPEIENLLSRGNTELLNFCRDFRFAVSKSGVQLVCSYRMIERSAKMSETLSKREVLRYCITKNLEKDDINMVYSNLRDKNNIYANTLKALGVA